jgi:hypothetical protein
MARCVNDKGERFICHTYAIVEKQDLQTAGHHISKYINCYDTTDHLRTEVVMYMQHSNVVLLRLPNVVWFKPISILQASSSVD